jgi:hypothetical protein
MNRRLLTTPGRWQPRGQPRQPVPTRRTIPTRTKNHDSMDEPKRGKTSENKSADGPPPCKRFSHLGKNVCQAGNTPMYELPTLPKYRNSTGQSTICWNNILKGCGWSECPLKRVGGHVPRNEITDSFADAVCNKLGKGVTYLINNHRTPYKPSPAKKTKTVPATETDITGDGQE